jgi:hypothetical protein
MGEQQIFFSVPFLQITVIHIVFKIKLNKQCPPHITGNRASVHINLVTKTRFVTLVIINGNCTVACM